jgi:hypothetical protein
VQQLDFNDANLNAFVPCVLSLLRKNIELRASGGKCVLNGHLGMLETDIARCPLFGPDPEGSGPAVDIVLGPTLGQVQEHYS